jgi:hypothetical protein
MATIVNTPGTSDSSGTNGLLIGIVLVVVVFALFWFFGMPYLRGGGTGSSAPTNNIENNVQAPEAPTGEGGDTNINVPVPDEVDVNIQGDNLNQ